MTGKKVEYHSLPYRSITHFAVETAGTFDLDAELKIWLSGLLIPITNGSAKGWASTRSRQFSARSSPADVIRLPGTR